MLWRTIYEHPRTIELEYELECSYSVRKQSQRLVVNKQIVETEDNLRRYWQYVEVRTRFLA